MSPASAMPPPRSLRPWEKEINLLDDVAVLIQHWKIIAFVLCTVFIIVVFNTYTMKPIYEASSTIHMKDKNNNIMQMSPSWEDPIASMNTEIAILKSRTIAEKVVQWLHLNWQVDKKSNGLSFKILEFTSTAKNPLYLIKMTAADKFEVKDENGELVGQGQSGILMKKNGFSLLINDINGKIGDSFQLNLVPLVNAALQLQGGFNAKEYGKQTKIIRASYISTDPILARDMVNALVQAYIEHSVDLKTEDTKRTVSFIDEQLKTLRGELDSSEKNLQVYKSNTGVIKLDDEATSLISKISEMQKNLTDVVLQMHELEFSRDALKNAMKKGTTYSPVTMKSDSLIANLATKLSELQVQKKALLTQYTEAHNAVKTLQNQIEEVQNKMLAVYETSMTNLARPTHSSFRNTRTLVLPRPQQSATWKSLIRPLLPWNRSSRTNKRTFSLA